MGSILDQMTYMNTLTAESFSNCATKPCGFYVLCNKMIVIKLEHFCVPLNLVKYAKSFSQEEEKEMAKGNQQWDKKPRGKGGVD